MVKDVHRPFVRTHPQKPFFCFPTRKIPTTIYRLVFPFIGENHLAREIWLDGTD